MKGFCKLTSLILTAVLLLTLAAPVLEARAAEGLVTLTLDGYYDYSGAQEMLRLVNDARATVGFDPLVLGEKLIGPAMQRASEVYVYNSTTRPDGSALTTLLPAPYDCSHMGQLVIVTTDSADDVMQAWMDQPATRNQILSSLSTCIGIGCFRQNDDTTAWVLMFNAARKPNAFSGSGTIPVTDIEVQARPENLVVQLDFAVFSNDFCDAYVYSGLTVYPRVSLLNRTDSGVVKTDVRVNSYSFTTGNPDVLAINNEEHYFKTIKPGDASLGLRIDGMPVRVRHNKSSLVDARIPFVVMETPSLTYEVDEKKTIHVDYSAFYTSPDGLNLSYKGSDQESWWSNCYDSDGIYDLYHADAAETHVFVMRYWDDYQERMVEVGERLVIRLDGGEPELPSEPTYPTEPEEVWLPADPDLPQRAGEPTLEEVGDLLEKLSAETYPVGTHWPVDTVYQWAAGTYTLTGGNSTDTGRGSVAFAMAVSDLIFGDLPVQVQYERTADDLRAGDIVHLKTGETCVVLDASPEYVRLACVKNYLKEYGLVVWNLLYPNQTVTDSIAYVLSRYPSESPGAAAIHPGIVPEDAVIADAGDSSVSPFGEYQSVLKWALTTDGTLYLYGYGHTAYRNDSWSSHKDEIRKVVIGPGVDQINSNDFQGYPALKEVVLGEDVAVIAEEAFQNCTALKRVVFSDALREIGRYAFRNSGLEEIILPEGLELLAEGAFYENQQLTRVSIPSTITEMGERAFCKCTALAELTLTEGLTVLGKRAFYGAASLKNVLIPGSLKQLPERVFYEAAALETVWMASGVESIGESAFSFCDSLTMLHLPDTLTEIQSSAFQSCDNLTKVYFYGTQEQWKTVDMYTDNHWLTQDSVEFHYMEPDECYHIHTTAIPGEEPTCTGEGLTAGTVCDDCGEAVIPQEPVPAVGHSWSQWRVEIPATYTAEGEQFRFCSVCGQGETEAIPRLEPLFQDVKGSSWYFAPVYWALERGITAGTGADTFSPEQECTRGQVVTFLWRANGQQEPYSACHPFDDVLPGSYYHDAVLWALDYNITAGTGAYTFSPEATCTRAQVVTFLWRSVGEPRPTSDDNPFTDVVPGSYYYDAVLWAVENGITAGTSDTTFSPTQTCTRGQVVTFLYRMEE